MAAPDTSREDGAESAEEQDRTVVTAEHEELPPRERPRARPRQRYEDEPRRVVRGNGNGNGRRRVRPRTLEYDRDHLIDEVQNFARSLTLGLLRQIESTSDITGNFAEDVLERNRNDDHRNGASRSRRRRPIEDDYDEPRARRSRYRDDDRYDDELYDDDYDDYLDYEDDDYDDDYDDRPASRSRRSSQRRGRRPRGRRSGVSRVADQFIDLQEDIYDGLRDAVHDWIDIPRRSFDEFYDSYDSEPRRRRSNGSRR
jgi:hypothetical protein